MKKLRLLSLSIVLLGFVFAVSLAQIAQPKEIELATPDKIIGTGILGLSVTTITELLKRKFKTTGIGSYAVSAVVSAGATASWLATAGQFALDSFGIYGTLVFLIANGLYKFVRKEPA